VSNVIGRKCQRWKWLVIMPLEEVTFFCYFAYVLLFAGYERWSIILHGALMFKSGVGDGV